MPHVTAPRLQRRSHAEVEQQRRVLEMAKVVAATVGQSFFQTLVEHLATGLGGDCVYVAELVQASVSKLRTVAVYRDGAAADGFEQDLQGSGAGQVLIDGLLAWSKDVRRIFPVDAVLQDMRAEGFVGIRLSDSAGQVIGLIALARRDPLANVQVTKAVMAAFAVRAAAELERKRADDALRESEQRYRAFIASSSDAMWRVELARPVPLDAPEPEQIDRIFRDGYIAECNDAMARLAGARNADELVGSQFSTLIPETDERIRGELLEAVRSRYGSATVFTTPTGDDGKKLYRLRTQCGIVENNELRRIWGTTRDITELKMAELAVEASERRFREVLENIHLPALMLNQTGAITFCNHALLGIANCAGGLLGRNWLDLIPDVRERATWSVLLSDKFAAEESRFHFEGVVHAQDDPPRLIVWDAIVLRDESGDTVGLAAIGSDLTDHRMLESRLAQAEKLEAIGRLAGGIAHDLNNSLTLIMGYVESALGQIERAGPLQNTLAGVQSAAADCAVLAEQLLAIGRRQQLRPELLNLNSVIAAQREMIERIIGPDINLVQEPDPAIGLIWFDPVQLRRILTNLAANSRDAMPGGGALTIATGNARVDSPADTSVTAPADYVRLTIADTGCGLSDEVKRHLFEPFFTTKPPGKGAGLGLTTVYAIISQSGGQISVRSPGIGTVIEILFPRVQGVPETPKTSVP